jgi:hypothetical protein
MHLGLAYYMMGEEKPARSLLCRQALASNVDFPGKDLARRHLEVLDIDPAKATPEVVQKLQDLGEGGSAGSRAAEPSGFHPGATANFKKPPARCKRLCRSIPRIGLAMVRLARLNADHLEVKDPRKALELAKQAHELAPSDDGSASGFTGRVSLSQRRLSVGLELVGRGGPSIPRSTVDLFYHLALA